MIWGATFSHRFAESLHLDVKEALNEYIALKFDLLRICVYWDEVQSSEDNLNLSIVRSLLERCQAAHQNVVVAVGMKAPRWPEFYFPSWTSADPHDQTTQKATLKFVAHVVEELKEYGCITAWQLENEALDPSGPDHMKVPYTFLQEEVETVRQLDQRAIVLTAWGNELSKRGTLTQLAPLADVVGIDLYGHQYLDVKFLGSRYVGPQDSQKKLTTLLTSTARPIWITELQAEPWEKNEEGYRSLHPKSMNAQILRQHIEDARALLLRRSFFGG
jgi:hypothetical protein